MTPDQHTIQETFVSVGQGHTLYVQEWGNPKGMPVLFLHGGPGGSCSERHRQLFNPAKHRVVFIDQRGCGRSLPYGSLEHNTTADLVEDIEKVAVHLRLQQFVLTGGSWGACLALAYGLVHPKRVKAMVLNGIFTGSQAEIDYFGKGEYRLLFPDIWEWLLSQVPKSQRHNPVAYLYRQALGTHEEAAKIAAYTCHQLETSLLSLDDRFTLKPVADYDPTDSRTEIHYMANRCFMPDRHILKQAHKLSMPIWLLQGRYDLVCPGQTAYELHKRLPNSELLWAVSGHRNEREMWNLNRSILLQLSRE